MHRVLRQRIEWEVAGVTPATVGGYHARLEQFQERTFLPALEQWLDRHFGGAKTYVIDRLELTVELDGTPHLERLTTDSIRSVLEKSLTGNGPEATIVKPLIAPTQGVALNRSNTAHTRVPDDGIHALLAYLRTGCLPSAYPSPDLLLRALPSDWLTRIRTTDYGWLPEWMIVRERIHRLLVASGREPTDAMPILAAVTSHSIAVADEAIPDRPTAPDEAKLNTPNPKTEAKPTTPSDRAVHPKNTQAHRPITQQENEGKISSRTEEHYYLTNAGIVLLHPYIDYLREQCGVTENGPLTAHLLHYAVFGHCNDAEWDHPLTKVLLGLAPTAFLPPAADEPTPEQLRQVDDLLDGVLAHWAALGSTDRDGLRANFLQREGKLERNGKDWSLTVNREAFDLLLDRLPWAISPVKNSAMRDPLNVYWI